jgi:hypothetical protein
LGEEDGDGGGADATRHGVINLSSARLLADSLIAPCGSIGGGRPMERGFGVGERAKATPGGCGVAGVSGRVCGTLDCSSQQDTEL